VGRHGDLIGTDELYRDLAATQLLDSVPSTDDEGVSRLSAR